MIQELHKCFGLLKLTASVYPTVDLFQDTWKAWKLRTVEAIATSNKKLLGYQ